MNFLLSVVLAAVTVQSVLSIKCYQCTSYDSAPCTTGVCETVGACKKSSIGTDGATGSVFDCHATAPEQTGEKPYCSSTGSGDTTIEVCTCTTEYCFKTAYDAAAAAAEGGASGSVSSGVVLVSMLIGSLTIVIGWN